MTFLLFFILGFLSADDTDSNSSQNKDENIVVVQYQICSNFGVCSATCGGGTQTCENVCVNGEWGDDNCDESKRINSQACNEDECPYIEICSNFETCTTLCGGGTKTCVNKCVGADWGDKDCPENQKINTQPCNEQQCGILYETPVSWLAENGFIEYYNKKAKVGNIQSAITPPSDSVELFIGCGRSAKIDETVQLGAVMSINEYNAMRRDYNYADITARSTRSYFSYYQYGDSSLYNRQRSTHRTSYYPLGFSADKNIYIGNYWKVTGDYYDCYKTKGEQKYDCPRKEMDAHRLSALTTYSSFSLWRCGKDTHANFGWRAFYETFSLVLYYRPKDCLFHVDCDVKHGFEVSIAKNCWNSENFNAVDDFFINSAVDEPEKYNNCKLKESSVLNVGFSDCGNALQVSGSADTRYSTYIHHRTENLDGIKVSQRSPVKITCKISYVTVNTAEQDVSVKVVVQDSIKEIIIGHEEEKLKAEFNLQLLAGRWTSSFSQISSSTKITIGEKIGIKLSHKSSFNRFQLSNCQVSANNKKIKLYENFCPDEDAAMFNLVRHDSIQFHLDSFRLDDSDSLEFSCTAHVYPGNYTLETCETDRRRRDSNEVDFVDEEPPRVAKLSAIVKIGEPKKSSSTVKNTIFLPLAVLILCTLF